MYYVSNEPTVPGKRYISARPSTPDIRTPRAAQATILYRCRCQPGRRYAIRQYALAYDDLPEATKRRIDPLKAVHVYLSQIQPAQLRR